MRSEKYKTVAPSHLMTEGQKRLFLEELALHPDDDLVKIGHADPGSCEYLDWSEEPVSDAPAAPVSICFKGMHMGVGSLCPQVAQAFDAAEAGKKGEELGMVIYDLEDVGYMALSLTKWAISMDAVEVDRRASSITFHDCPYAIRERLMEAAAASCRVPIAVAFG